MTLAADSGLEEVIRRSLRLGGKPREFPVWECAEKRVKLNQQWWPGGVLGSPLAWPCGVSSSAVAVAASVDTFQPVRVVELHW